MRIWLAIHQSMAVQTRREGALGSCDWQSLCRSLRLGLIQNDQGVHKSGIRSREVLASDPGGDADSLFGPGVQLSGTVLSRKDLVESEVCSLCLELDCADNHRPIQTWVHAWGR